MPSWAKYVLMKEGKMFWWQTVNGEVSLDLMRYLQHLVVESPARVRSAIECAVCFYEWSVEVDRIWVREAVLAVVVD